MRRFFIATRHEEFRDFDFPEGAEIIDPWRYIDGARAIGKNGHSGYLDLDGDPRMLRVGFIGLGKLGLPVALAVENAGHTVWGWDTDSRIRDLVLGHGTLPYIEEGAQELLNLTQIKIARPETIAQTCDLVFIAVQTPHQPRFEGVTRLPDERADFDYTWLRQAVASVENAKRVVVISTVLPGTIEREIGTGVLYNPFFIAMGTTIPDFRSPEFVLVGTDEEDPTILSDFYATIHDAPVFVTSIKTAELTKVAYNAFIGLKIAFGNTIMELAEKTGADCDGVIDALSLATERVISPAYMRGGMGDGGGCHPRDNIALSWLAREVGLSYDIFEAMMICREAQTEWLASICAAPNPQGIYGWSIEEPLTVLGKSYKPGTNLTVGSPALLLAEMLKERGVEFEHVDPYVGG